MTRRATLRGAERTPLDERADVLICGASFAGLTVARELHGSGARVLMIDRYEIGERQTSACAAPTAWLQNLELGASIRQTFGDLVVHTPSTTSGALTTPRSVSIAIGAPGPASPAVSPVARPTILAVSKSASHCAHSSRQSSR